MKKILKNQAGITLVEILLATVILGFIVSGVVLLSGSIVKTNTTSYKESQAMAYATIISELVKDKYKTEPLSRMNESTVELKSTVEDESGINNDYSIEQDIIIPKVGDKSTGLIEYLSKEETGFTYTIQTKAVVTDGSFSSTNTYLKTTVTIENKAIGKQEIAFTHNY